MTTSLSDAISLIVISDLPDDLFREIGVWYSAQSARETISENAVLAYVRHRYSNYDHLLRLFELKQEEVDALRCEVNQQAKQTISRWKQ